MDFVTTWNNKFPLDRWLRKKYNIRFNSPEHRDTNLIDALFEYKEEKLYSQAQKHVSEQLLKIEKFKKEGWISEKEIKVDEKTFENIDYSLFDDDTKENNI